MSHPRRDLGVEAFDDGLLILDKRAQKLHQLNETASLIWTGLTEGKNAESLIQLLVEKFDIGEDEARSDIKRVLEDFTRLSLLESENSA